VVHGLNLVQAVNRMKQTRGTSSRETAKHEILCLAADRKEHKSSYFVKQLENSFSKNTVYKYLRELVDEELMEVKPGSSEEHFKPKFLITKRGLEKVNQALKKEQYMEIGEWFAELSPSEAKVWLERSVNEIIRLRESLEVKDKRIREDMDDSIIMLKTFEKIAELSGKELRDFSVKKYREDLKKERKKEGERRKAVMAEYVKKHPELERLRQGSLEELNEYIRGFEEYYKKKSSAGSAEERSKQKETKKGYLNEKEDP